MSKKRRHNAAKGGKRVPLPPQNGGPKRTTPPKSTSVRLLLAPEQLATWHRAAAISHEGNLSMFVRSAADGLAAVVISKDNAKDAYK